MYKVFLVEDEIVTREGIRNSIPWEHSPYQLAGEAPDGEMALPALRDIKPDILITDIKMPFMDGLALSRIIKRDLPWIKIIILSGHDEFEYAKEAISIGVEEYLLKPISSQDMMNSLDKVARQIEEEKRRFAKQESNKEIFRDKWMVQLVTGQLSGSGAIESARSMGIDLIAQGYLVVIIDVSAPSGDYSRLSHVRKIVEEMLKDRKDFILFDLSVEKLAFLAKNISRDALDEIIYPLAQSIKFEVERNTRCRLALGIGSVVDHIEEIRSSFSEADKAVAYMRLTGKRNIIGAGDLSWCRAEESSSDEGEQLTEKIRFALPEETREILEPYLNLAGDSSSWKQNAGYFALVYRDLLEGVCRLIEDLQGDPREILPDAFVRNHVENASLSRESFVSMAGSIIERWMNFRDARINNRHQLIIREARKYMEEHFHRSDLSLNHVAGHVNLSPNHFSTVFSQESGQTFIEYLTSIRIRRAGELLLYSKKKCADIAFETGYSDPHYFSYIFKKSMGVSPREYRKGEGIEAQDA